MRNQKPDADTEDVAGPVKESGEPANKKRKTVQHKKLAKKVFDVAPRKMSDRVPSSWQTNVPFATMVAKKWCDDHPEMRLLDGASWLAGFYKNLKEDDLLKEDRDYLKELAEWHNDEDSTSEIGTGSANE